MLAFCQGTQRAGGEHGTGEYLLMDEHYQVLSYIDDPFALTVPGRPSRGFSAKRPDHRGSGSTPGDRRA
jgi:hypothetical protein